MSQIIKRYLLLILFIGAFSLGNAIDRIDSLEYQLRNNIQPQEKIYIHTDNNSYFAGDTLWYKAYVLRADNLHPTDMSKLLYVELLTPDGYLVERQRIIIDHNTQSFGQFCLPDTIYSGYYELRAYTRWQLNFNSSQRKHEPRLEAHFVDQKYVSAFFRDYEGLYSRVLAIYDKPKKLGNYTERYITGRPKRHQLQDKKGLDVKFFPESGALVFGLKSTVAFEVLEANGKPLAIEGHLDDGTVLKTNNEGRGVFLYTYVDSLKHIASFSYKGKDYTFPLPECTTTGAVISYDALNEIAHIQSNGVVEGGVSVMCRGKLVSFQKGDVREVHATEFPTGVNEIVVYDEKGNPLASRYIFVNHQDLGNHLSLRSQIGQSRISSTLVNPDPFDEVTLHLHSTSDMPSSYSVSVCDCFGDMPSFDDGNILTSLLLEGDLKGFVAHPAYYFESKDDVHRLALDLLMMIQGWKKYGGAFSLLHEPEKTLTIDGKVTKVETPYIERSLLQNYRQYCRDHLNPCLPWTNRIFDKDPLFQTEMSPDSLVMLSEDQKQILIETELKRGNLYINVMSEPDADGSFSINIPPFYGKTMLLMCAYQRKDSSNHCLSSTIDRHKYNPFVTPNYEVRRSMFYPQMTIPYSWFQTHTPEDNYEFFDSGVSGLQISERDHVLEDVSVTKRRRQVNRGFDKNKPVMKFDFWDLYNLLFDQGMAKTCNAYEVLHNGDVFLFPIISLVGYYNSSASIDGHYFMRPKGSDLSLTGIPMSIPQLDYLLHPKQIDSVRVFTDFDRRNQVGKEPNDTLPTVWFQLSSRQNKEPRLVLRDRRIEIDGIAVPMQFYHRDYSNITPDSSDYRRTLYWNPNAHPDADGNLNISFYNGSRKSHLKVSVCGINNEGKIFYY